MFKILDLKYYKIEVNDESKEIKCTQIVIYKKFNPSKNKTLLEFFVHVLKLNHKVQYDYDSKLSLPKYLYFIMQSKI